MASNRSTPVELRQERVAPSFARRTKYTELVRQFGELQPGIWLVVSFPDEYQLRHGQVSVSARLRRANVARHISRTFLEDGRFELWIKKLEGPAKAGA